MALIFWNRSTTYVNYAHRIVIRHPCRWRGTQHDAVNRHLADKNSMHRHMFFPCLFSMQRKFAIVQSIERSHSHHLIVLLAAYSTATEAQQGK